MIMTTENDDKKHFRDPVILICVIIGVMILLYGFGGGLIEDLKNITRINRENAAIYLVYLAGLVLAARLVQNFWNGVIIDYRQGVLSYP